MMKTYQKAPKVETLSVFQFLQRIPDEQAARLYFEKMRWGKTGRFCPHCASTKTVEVKDEKPQPYRCKDCRKHFSIRTGSVLRESNLPLQKWLFAAYLMTTAKKGLSSYQMARELGVTQKTAWFLCQRVREIWTNPSSAFSGAVEVDETYLGGKEKNKHADKRLNAGRGTVGKQIVVGMRERTGKIKATTIPNTTKEVIHHFINKNAVPGTKIYSDDHQSYLGLEYHRHASVNHSGGEYVRGEVHTNGIESFWALLKRGYYGTYHSFSPEHAVRYAEEFAFRLNNRFCDTEDLLAITAKSIVGKKLSYKLLIGETN
jgi:transposase-like protein